MSSCEDFKKIHEELCKYNSFNKMDNIDRIKTLSKQIVIAIDECKKEQEKKTFSYMIKDIINIVVK